jgi:hypothetical protein
MPKEAAIHKKELGLDSENKTINTDPDPRVRNLTMDTDLDPVHAPAPGPALFFSGCQNANQSSKIKVTKNSKSYRTKQKKTRF